MNTSSLLDRARSELRIASPHIIERVETIPLRTQLPRVFRGSHYEMSTRVTVLTRIHTASGLVGEAYVGDEDEGLDVIRAIVDHELSPLVVGQDAMAIQSIWRATNAATMDILRDRRLGLVAQAAIDAALWDLVGKACRQPLWRLWGGDRSAVPLIAIGGYYGDVLGTIEEEIAYYRDVLGLAGIKFKVGGRSPREDAERFARARAAAGDDWVIAADANQAWTFEEAREFSVRTSDLDLAWLEEPVRWQDDRRVLRDLRMSTGVRVCAGQSELSVAGCRELMELGAIDYCNFDSSWSGGPTAWLQAAAVAASYGVAVGHHEEPQISTHLIASQPHGGFAECFHPDRDPFWWSLARGGDYLKDGLVHLTDRPGLGWALDEDYIDDCRTG
jgi:D-galactarolactone cycloisomerase